MTKICRHCFVSGKVQGVYYRQATKDMAIANNLSGWVRNTADDRVEVLVCGAEAQVLALLDWLSQGPPRAQVTNVEIHAIAYQEYDSFNILPT